MLCFAAYPNILPSTIDPKVFRTVPSAEPTFTVSLFTFIKQFCWVALRLQMRLRSSPQTYWRYETSRCKHWKTKASSWSTICSVPSCRHPQCFISSQFCCLHEHSGICSPWPPPPLPLAYSWFSWKFTIIYFVLCTFKMRSLFPHRATKRSTLSLCSHPPVRHW